MSSDRYPLAPAQNAMAVLTPYLIPEALRGKKVVNLGDGFILSAIERLVGRFDRSRTISPRVKPTPQELELVFQRNGTILAGANQLKDDYTIWPGLTASEIDQRQLRLIPFGIGIHGEPGFNDGLTQATRDILRAIHRHIEYSSWRCPRTVQFLRRELPEIAGQFLMTGCPVVYDRPLLSGQPFQRNQSRIAVTVTERNDFWDRETQLINFVARRFPRSKKYLVLHQNYSPPVRFEHLKMRWTSMAAEKLNPYQRLRQYAIARGFRVFAPVDADRCIEFYDTIDLHLGSRLHAHLLFLSRAKRSVLIPVDGRSPGIAESLGFPLLSPENLEQGLQFDFEVVRENARNLFATMQKFCRSLPRGISQRAVA